jgi:hypothetical protein
VIAIFGAFVTNSSLTLIVMWVVFTTICRQA